MTEFAAWPKTPRLFRDMIVTEKIDGTNAGIHVERVASYVEGDDIAVTTEGEFRVVAQSRKRLIYPGDDNFGFAGWVRENKDALATILGEGVHYGEWWGSGIQRGYGLEKGEKRFSLFNVSRWGVLDPLHQDYAGVLVEGLSVVPILHEGVFDTDMVRAVLDDLAGRGSYASPGFDKPEGVIVYHTAAGLVFKALIENDDAPKGEG